MMKMLKMFLVAFTGLLPLATPAQDTAPDALVKTVTDEVLQILRSDPDIRSGSTRRAIDLVEKKVLPHFNFNHMTALAVGRDWRRATPEQKKMLADEFRTLLVRTYSNALVAYRDQTVDFKPFRMQPGETDVIVRTLVNQPGGKPISIDYNLEKTAQGWKVYDVIVGGVSLVTNYRDSFAQEVRASGIDGLIKALQAKNRSLDTSARAQAK